MKKCMIKRGLGFFLAVLMILSMFPLSTLAEEWNTEGTESPTLDVITLVVDENTYVITFEPGDGEGESWSETYDVGESCPLPDDQEASFTCEGNTFLGWDINGRLYDSGYEYIPGSDDLDSTDEDGRYVIEATAQWCDGTPQNCGMYCFTKDNGLELTDWNEPVCYGKQGIIIFLASDTEFGEIGIETEFTDGLRCVGVWQLPLEMEQEMYNRYGGQYSYLIMISATAGCSAFYKSMPFELYARSGNTTYHSNSGSQVVSDVLLMDPEYVKDCVDQGNRVYISTPAYSAYDVAQNGYRTPINMAYGWAIDTETFQSIADAPLNVCMDDLSEIIIPKVSEEQKGINFSYKNFFYDEWPLEKLYFSFLDQSPIKSDFTFDWNLGITYYQLRQLFRRELDEKDTICFAVLKDGAVYEYLTVDFITVDDAAEVEILFNNKAGEKLGTYELVVADEIIASGYCGGDTTSAYDSTSKAYKNLWWKLDSEGTLTIGGEGTMMSYGETYNTVKQLWITGAPWGQYIDQLKTLVIGNGVTSIGEDAFCNCSGFTGDLVIPNSVTSIEYRAFYGCSGFTGDLVIGNSVTSIGNSAFSGCSGFTGDLVIGNSVTSIGRYAFLDCSGFTGDLVIPDSVTSIGEYAFGGCSGFTGDLVIPDSVTSIGEGAFSGCTGFTGDLVIPNSVTSIGGYAFSGTSCYRIFFMGNAPTIGSNVKGYTTLYYLEGTSGWTEPTYAGYPTKKIVTSGYCGKNGGTNLAWSVDNNGVLTISGSGKMEDYASAADAPWSSAPFSSLVLEEGMTTVGTKAFYDYSNIKGDLVIPDTVVSIHSWAFYDCDGLDGTLTLGSGLKEIGESAFEFCGNLNGSLIIPDGVVEIGGSAFCDCSGFTGNLVLGKDLETVGASAFNMCSGFTGDLIFGDNLKTIGWRAFENCSGFTGNLVIGNSVTSIEDSAFWGCSGFTGSLVIPDGVINIGSSAFSDCSGFTGDLVIPNSVTYIDRYAFYGCSGFQSLTLGNTRTVHSSAFEGCTGLTGDLVIPANASISTRAFAGCMDLENIYFMGSAPDIPESWKEDAAFEDTVTFYYLKGTDGWTSPAYKGYATAPWDIGFDDTALAYGFCGGEGNGTNLKWVLSEDGVLKITGTGKMRDKSFDDICGWEKFDENIMEIVIESGVTHIGNDAFGNEYSYVNYPHVEKIVFPDTVQSIGWTAFWACPNLNSVYYMGDAPSIGSSAFPYNTILFHKAEASGWTEPTYAGYTSKIWYEEPTITIGSITLTKNAERTVSIHIEGAPAITGMQFTVQYDAEKLKLESFNVPNGVFSCAPTVNADDPGKVYFVWEDVSPLIADGAILNLTFSAYENAPEGDTPITFDQNDVFLIVDEEYKNIPLKAVSGRVTVRNVVIGDINNDGDINVIDANIVRRFAAKIVTLTNSQKLAADVNGDGSINVIDANLIRRYAAKLITEFPEAN